MDNEQTVVDNENHELREIPQGNIINSGWTNVDKQNILPTRTRGVRIDFNELLNDND